MSKQQIFIDQVLSGFDLSLPDFGVAAFVEKRQAIIADTQITYVLEFMEIGVDTYECLPHHRPGQLNPTHRNVLIWKNPREPYAVSYWSLLEFKRLVDLLSEHGVDHVMVRTFFTFNAKIGHGRFLRQENNPHSHAFEWRRADEFCRRHPEVRDKDSYLLNWNAELQEDPLYHIEPGLRVGDWFARQLLSFFSDLGVRVVRLGDGSFGGDLQHSMSDAPRQFLQMNRDLHQACQKHEIKMLSSLGPYWTFDAWHNGLGIDFNDLPQIADWVLTQPLETWTDRYGFMHIHNGEYFNAGAGHIHALVNNALVPGVDYIRGLDAGDMIENWHTPEGMPLRESFDAYTLWSRRGEHYDPCYQGLYHFWSDELESTYYQAQIELHQFMRAQEIDTVFGPELLVTPGQKPHDYMMGDFFESCGYGMRVSIAAADVIDDPRKCYVLFLPRCEGDAVCGEEAMSDETAALIKTLYQSQAQLIVFGGARDAAFLEQFGLRYQAGAFSAQHWHDGSKTVTWYDHAVVSERAGMAGKPEAYKRSDYLQFEAAGAEVRLWALDDQDARRPVLTQHQNAHNAKRIYVSGIPEDAAQAVASDIIAETCQLPYRLTIHHDQHAYVSSFAFRNAQGETYLALVRTAAWHDAPVRITIDAQIQGLCLAYGVEWCDGELSMQPQSYVLFQLLNT